MLRLWHAEPRYSADSVYYFAAASRAMAAPATLFDLDYVGRVHPLFISMLAASLQIFGPSLPPLIVLVYAGHLAAVLAMRRLVMALGGSETEGFAAGFLLAVFSGANNLFADPIHFSRTLNLGVALAALTSLALGRRGVYVVLWLVTLANFEDAITLPIAGVFVAALTRRAHWRSDAPLHGALLAVMAGYLAAFSLNAAISPFHSWRGDLLRKVLLLPVEVARATFLPRSDLGLAESPRWVIAAIAVGLVLWGATRGRRLAVRHGLLIATSLTFALPYLARDTGGQWPSRYLYFPAAPLLATLAVAFPGLPRSTRALLFALLAAIGLANGERAATVIAERHLQSLDPAETRGLVDATALAIAGHAVTVSLDAAGCGFVMDDLAPRTRLRIGCATATPDGRLSP